MYHDATYWLSCNPIEWYLYVLFLILVIDNAHSICRHIYSNLWKSIYLVETVKYNSKPWLVEYILII